MFLPLMGHLPVARPVGRPRTRPDAVRGDKAYVSRAMPEPSDQQVRRKRRRSRGGRSVRFDAADYEGRNVIERCYCQLKQWRGLATRYDKHAIVYRAAVILKLSSPDPAIVRHALGRQTMAARSSAAAAPTSGAP